MLQWRGLSKTTNPAISPADWRSTEAFGFLAENDFLTI
jgi:hypothetical protein